MQEGPGASEEGRAEIDSAEEVATRDDAVVHDQPVRIPVSALPPKPQDRGPAFATTFMIGVAAAPWFAAAFVTGERVAVVFAGVWLAFLLLDLLRTLRR